MSGSAASPITKPFLGIEIQLAGSVLVPRAETELLGATAIRLVQELDGPLKVIDMCCGSGNLALAIAHHLPNAKVRACDLTEDCIATTKENARLLGLHDRVTTCRGDLFSALPHASPGEETDLIVCNPPYISSGRLENESAHLLENEPRAAFDGGPYGISVLQRLVRDAAGHLKEGGWLAFEFGEGQHKQALHLLKRAKCYVDIQLIDNNDSVPRVAIARKEHNQ
ncbi:peptide chain release factor N(5)-glutamine methyltransferase [Labrenzia sp. R4_2]|uniref:N5-glutamine methyltransferase family protein n=1 Tax=Labrenzia sp. R4_2 TaxID=2821107 RepID=UPI001ADA4115|nr:HemK/PrmC family methyltransferase [Labrenzia sp. R4_2]MBO9422144.1 peptide chain release factor N(5)-glutamine methyltransferase [Labrenzia sp. R4_2]